MDDAECVETNEKSSFRFLFFELSWKTHRKLGYKNDQKWPWLKKYKSEISKIWFFFRFSTFCIFHVNIPASKFFPVIGCEYSNGASVASTDLLFRSGQKSCRRFLAKWRPYTKRNLTTFPIPRSMWNLQTGLVWFQVIQKIANTVRPKLNSTRDKKMIILRWCRSR